ncbi:MAG TPA: hypothetical protein VKF41_06425 [Bryobacteraceae bacterium]|nr:hypothetical protein [Bryobacteraceae bacterium]
MTRTMLWGVMALSAAAAAAFADGIPIVTNALGTVTWVEYSPDPVYSPGKAYYPTVIEVGNTYMMWSEYTTDNSTGEQLATSPDGVTWTTVGQVTGLLNPAHAVVEDIGGTYRMWYWNSDATNLYTINTIRTATSTDGLNWNDDQAITQVGATVIAGGASSAWNRGSYGPEDILYNPNGSPTLVAPVDAASVWANKYVMYYDGATGSAEDMGLAVSNDGVNWEGYNGGVAPVLTNGALGTWDSGYVGYGAVIEVGPGEFDLYYSGGVGSVLNQGIGFATSTNGIDWVKSASNPIFSISDGVTWRDERTYTPMVIGNQMWFSGVGPDGYAIGYAQAELPEPATFGAGLAALALLLAGARVGPRQVRGCRSGG